MKQVCECGCGQLLEENDKYGRPIRFIRGHNSKGKTNPMYGKKNLKRTLLNIQRKGLFKHNKNTKKKISKSLTGKYYIKITKEELTEMYFKKRLSLPQISEKTGFSVCALHNALKRFSIPTMHNNKVSGRKHHAFNNWSSREPYGVEWNDKLRVQIRIRDSYRCQECFRHQNELFTKSGKPYKLHIHHLDYDKNNNASENLISLCRGCHSQTNFGRDDWTNYYQEMVGGGIV